MQDWVIILLALIVWAVYDGIVQARKKKPTPTPVPTPTPTGQHLTLVVASSVSTAEVAAYLAAQNVQLADPKWLQWNAPAYIDQAPGGWLVSLLDTSDAPGDLGYHDVDSTGKPFARVFVLTSQQDSVPWSSVASHEVLEMLVDPQGTRTVKGPDGCTWIVEVGDPVEDQFYTIDGVVMSDYVLPPWFNLAPGPGFDAMGLTKTPFQLDGGYQSEDCGSGWTTINGAKARARAGARTDAGHSARRFSK